MEGAHTVLYDPSSPVNTDNGINEWVKRGLPANKMVLGLAYHGYTWALVDHNDNDIGAPAKSGSIIGDGSQSYDYIHKYLRSYKIDPVYYNSTYVINYFTFGLSWVGFDDVKAIRAKVAYAKEKGILGYNAWQVPNDHNWELSEAYVKEMMSRGKSSDHNQQVISFADISEATNCFLEENKLGEGGYGPVYKVLILSSFILYPRRRSMLNWEKWVEIIEGIIEGLLYLQEYSRLTIVHRDLKASNILLDAHLKPRISDFGIAKSFQDNETEASTYRIVGTFFSDSVRRRCFVLQWHPDFATQLNVASNYDSSPSLRIWDMQIGSFNTGSVRLPRLSWAHVHSKCPEDGGVNDDILLDRMRLMKQLHDIKSLDPSDYLQKAKLQWAVEGDENSKFFHGVINRRRLNLAIKGVMVDGTWVDDPSHVKNEFCSHFATRFQSPSGNRSKINFHFPNRLSSDQADLLELPISAVEIRNAVWACGENKSPGPDGFTFEFFRKFWDVLGKDFSLAIMWFFDHYFIGQSIVIRIALIRANNLYFIGQSIVIRIALIRANNLYFIGQSIVIRIALIRANNLYFIGQSIVIHIALIRANMGDFL
ncbi:chitinase II [Tanacetum coccineum]